MQITVNQFDRLKKILLDAKELLEEVRTGEDFEVVCYNHADKIGEFLNKELGIKTDYNVD